MKTMRVLNNQHGFTLIEALVAISILVVGILSLYTMQIISIQGNAKANQVTLGASWAGNQIESVMLRDLKDIPDIFADSVRFPTNLTGSPRPSRENYSNKRITLLDRTNDGSSLAQDINNNALDDDNVDAIPNFGLDAATAATADFWEQSPDNRFILYYNFAIDIPFPKIVTVRILVQEVNTPSPPVVFTYYKDDTI